MTEIELKELLVKHFFTLNTFSGITFLQDDNVDLRNNKAFTEPTDKRFFVVQFLPDTPESIAIGNNDVERFTGIFQIDIITPIDKGLDEADTKYKWLKKLFKKGTEIEEITVNNVYKASSITEDTYYRTVVRVEWTADITND